MKNTNSLVQIVKKGGKSIMEILLNVAISFAAAWLVCYIRFQKALKKLDELERSHREKLLELSMDAINRHL